MGFISPFSHFSSFVGCGNFTNKNHQNTHTKYNFSILTLLPHQDNCKRWLFTQRRFFFFDQVESHGCREILHLMKFAFEREETIAGK